MLSTHGKQDAKEREGKVQYMNKDNQTTIGELQSIIDGLREMEQENQQVLA